eukprot:PhM_4_TR15164/c0_g1_i1/m.15466
MKKNDDDDDDDGFILFAGHTNCGLQYGADYILYDKPVPTKAEKEEEKENDHHDGDEDGNEKKRKRGNKAQRHKQHRHARYVVHVIDDDDDNNNENKITAKELVCRVRAGHLAHKSTLFVSRSELEKDGHRGGRVSRRSAVEVRWIASPF